MNIHRIVICSYLFQVYVVLIYIIIYCFFNGRMFSKFGHCFSQCMFYVRILYIMLYMCYIYTVFFYVKQSTIFRLKLKYLFGYICARSILLMFECFHVRFFILRLNMFSRYSTRAGLHITYIHTVYIFILIYFQFFNKHKTNFFPTAKHIRWI